MGMICFKNGIQLIIFGPQKKPLKKFAALRSYILKQYALIGENME
jgi:hypothetical protein